MNDKNCNFYGINLLKNERMIKNIVWGDFEFIDFSNSSEKFANHTNKNIQNDKDYIPNNRIYIYDCIPEKSSLVFDNNDKLFKDKNQNHYNFIGISLFNLNNKVISNNNSSNIIQETCNLIEEKLSETDQLIFHTYGSLNSYDICVICLFNDINQFILHAESIQVIGKDKTPLFESSYSVLMSPHLNKETNVFSSSSGIANIQISYNCYCSFDSITMKVLKCLGLIKDGLISEKYKELVKIFSTLGEYDIVIQLPINLLNNKLYTDILNPDTDFYKDYIQQCNTRFSIIKGFPTNNSLQNKFYNNLSKENKDNFFAEAKEKYEYLTENILYKTNSCIHEIYDMFFNDYRKAYEMSNRNEVWKQDLTAQFIAIVDFSINAFNEYVNDNKSFNVFDYSLKCVNIFIQSIYHIKQSNSFNLEIIQSLFRNAVTYDKIINCYYYIVKSILQTVYLYGNKEQSELIPFISFEAVPIIKSELIGGSSFNTTKIVSIILPYDTFYNIEKYIPLLFHEIGHYVCPNDRVKRNYYAFIIIMSVVLNEKLNICYQIFNSDELMSDIYNYVISYISSNILNQYEEFFSYTWYNFISHLKFIINIALGLTPTYNMDKYPKMSIMLFWVQNILINIEKQICDDYKLNETSSESIPKYCIDDIWNPVNDITEGIREATADIFMIKNTAMKIEEYFALYIFVRSQNSWALDDTLMSCIRIGIITESFFNRTEEETNVTFFIDDKISEKILQLCKKIIPEVEDQILIEELNEIKNKYNSFQEKWRTLFYIFKQIIYTVDLNIESIDDENLSEFYNLLQQNKMENENHETYLNWIKLSFRPITLNDLNKTHLQQSAKFNNKNFILTSKKKINIKQTIPTYYIQSANNFNLAIEMLHNDVIGTKDDVFWYRGHASDKWDLKPNLFRNHKDNCYAFLKNAYNEFVSQSADSVELIGSIRTEADWISYMQHYQIPTNFLDWSEQPLSALYFALEDFLIDSCKYSDESSMAFSCKKSQRENLTDDATIWILNPERMNKLLYPSIINDSTMSYIPNLSIPNNISEETKRFLINDDSYIHKQAKNAGKNELELYKPMAITTAKLNNRLRCQKGHFIAYDLYTNKKVSADDQEILIDVQKYHEKFFEKNQKNYSPFLARIVIPVNLKQDMADYVNNMRITPSSIYPELMNIGTDITRYFNRKFPKS